jgi:uncharacterized protein (TIGR02246 family)
MRNTFALIALMALSGVGLLVAAAQVPQQPKRATPAQALPVVDSSKKAAPVAKAAPATRAEDEPIRAVLQAFAKAFNIQDAKALTEMFIDDGLVVDPSGEDTRGKAAIGEMYATSFQQVPGLKLESAIQEVRLLTPDVARAAGQARLATGTGDATGFTKFSALLVRHDGKWQVAELREYPTAVEDISAYDRLRELEWMVGDWVDESENNRVSSSVRWADNQSFLVRMYKLEIQGEKASSGTMFIGWDPQTGQIKSWLFNSEGGHGEGLWTRTAENTWVVKAQGVLRDGRPTSATQIHTVLNKDSVKTSSIDRIIGGQVAPDIADVVMVRRPPQPGVAVPAPAAAAKGAVK